MNCSKCLQKAVFSSPALCKNHFLAYFESKVKETIQKYKLLPNKKIKLVVACSGGKDSTVALYLLNKWGYKPTALAIDEGIKGYRPHTLLDLQKFCRENKIPLQIYSFQKEFGASLDKILKKLGGHPFYACGILRRYLLNQKSRSFDVIATGHNLDDESQSILMNLCNGNLALSANLGPKTGAFSHKKFTERIKPLYFCSEKEVMAYSLLKEFEVSYHECPYAYLSFRGKVRDGLNELELSEKNVNERLVKNFIGLLPAIRKKYSSAKEPQACRICGEAGRQEICRACQIVEQLVGNKTTVLKQQTSC